MRRNSHASNRDLNKVRNISEIMDEDENEEIIVNICLIFKELKAAQQEMKDENRKLQNQIENLQKEIETKDDEMRARHDQHIAEKDKLHGELIISQQREEAAKVSRVSNKLV